MPSEPHSVTTFEPVADMAIVHHMLVFGCREKELSKTLEKYELEEACFRLGKKKARQKTQNREGTCARTTNKRQFYSRGEKTRRLLHMPQNAGFRIGEERNTFNRLVLEVHYLDPNGEVDSTNNNRKGKVGL